MSLDRTKEIPFQPSTIENIDIAMYNWVEEKMNIFTDSKTGWKKVETIWVLPERAWLSKKTTDNREKTGALVLPIISIERKNIVKDLGKKGKAVCTIPLENDEKGGSNSIVIAKRIKQDKTANFINAETKQRTGQINFPRKSEKIVYETMTIPMPVYIEINYEIKIKTLYQQQMNDILQSFTTKTLGINYFIIKNEGHRYESFMGSDFVETNSINKLSKNERFFETTFGIKVLGYLVGSGKNEEQNKIIIRENAVSVKFPREHVIFGDIPIGDNNGYYGISGLGSTIKSKK